MRKGGEIYALLREGITDEDLPLRREFFGEIDDKQWSLQGRTGKLIKTLDGWTRRAREKFSDVQRLMTSPVFEFGEHYELDDNIVLPFISFRANERTLEFRGGGYSEVSIRYIHPSHHGFWEDSPLGVRPQLGVRQHH
jgi:hypothetical protein